MLKREIVTLYKYILDKIVRNGGSNNIELNKISNVVDRILHLTKRSYYFYSSKEPFDYIIIECNSSCYFVFRQRFGFFYIKISYPKRMIKLKVRKFRCIENYKKKLQILTKKLDYLIKYTMVN